MVCFLEEDICSNSRILEFFIVFDSSCGDIYVYTADSSVFVVNAIYRLYALEDIFDRVIDRVFARFYCEAFMSHILKRDDFFFYFLLGEFFSRDSFILRVVGAIDTSVDTIVRQIKRCEHYDSVTIELELYLLGYFIHFLYFFGDITREKHRCFAVGESAAGEAMFCFFRASFFQYCVDKLNVIFIRFRIGERFEYFFVVDKFFCFS